MSGKHRQGTGVGIRPSLNRNIRGFHAATRRLVAIIREQGWQRFTSRDVLRLNRAGLSVASDLNLALAALEEGDCIRAIENPPGPRGGRPTRLFTVNPAVHVGAP